MTTEVNKSAVQPPSSPVQPKSSQPENSSNAVEPKSSKPDQKTSNAEQKPPKAEPKSKRIETKSRRVDQPKSLIYPLKRSSSEPPSNSPYPLPDDGVPQQKQQKRPKEKSRLEKCLPLIKGCVFLEAVCISLCLIMLAIGGLRFALYKETTWHLIEEPVNANFEQFSVSSPSETCNEFARSFFVESHDVELLSAFMMVCLGVTEPHASGMGGSSILVTSNRTHCFQSTGNARIPSDLWPFYHEMTQTNTAEWTGAYSAAIPGDIRSYQAAAQLVPKDQVEEISFLLMKMHIEFEGLKLPVSHRLAKSLKKWRVHSTMTARKQFNNYLTRSGFPLDEGDVFEHSFDFNFMRRLIAEEKASESKRQLYSELLREMNPYDRSLYMEELFNSTDKKEPKTHPLQKGFYAQIGDSDLSICSGYHGDVITSTPLSPFVLSQMNPADLPSEFWDRGLEKMLADPKFFEWIAKGTGKIWNMTGEIAKRKLDAMDDDMKQAMEQLGNIDRRDWDVSISGNSFVLVDHKRDVASVMSATLGNSFGSMMSQLGKRKMVVLNNLMAGTGRNFMKEGDLRNVKEPIIIRKNGTIRVAYAADGGSIAQSLEAPRKLTSLAFSLFGDIPLLKALSTPLYFQYKDEELVGTPDFPSKRFGLLTKDGRKRRLAEDHGLLDSVVAVDGEATIFFNGRADSQIVFPNGI